MPLALWTMMAFGCIITFRFMWLLLVSVALALNAVNVVGYVKCKRDAGKKGAHVSLVESWVFPASEL